jgi:DNA-binding transcriptional MerR regulator
VVGGDDMYYKIKEVSDMSGVSIRMLRYYDKLGLLIPNNVSQAGYRLYTEEDIEKLSQILFYKELDFSLDEIKEIINISNSNKIDILKIQEQILMKKKDKIEALLSAIRKTIDSFEFGKEPQIFNIFTSFDMAQINRNKEKLKNDMMMHVLTLSGENCGERTSNYTKEDWTIVMSKADSILNKICKLMDKGAENTEVQRLVGEFKEFINNNLIKCDSTTYKVLGDLYVKNPIYRNYIEQYSSHFPEFLKKAIHMYEGNSSKY